jgi:hypothetical protein
VSSAANLRLVSGIGLIDVSTPELPKRLAGNVSEQLELFAAQMRQGLLAAPVSVGLEVMGELMEAEVTELAGPKASTTWTGGRIGTAARTARSPWGAGGSR